MVTMSTRGGSSGDAEIRLRSRLLDDAEKAGLWGSNVNDRFVSAKPDIRLAYKEWGQRDIELKILGVADSTIRSGREVLSGVTKLQEIEMREMNKHGAPAVGLILIPEYSVFVFCNFKHIIPRDAMAGPNIGFNSRKADGPAIDFFQLFQQSELYLRRIDAW
jgi:hypothetical protein